MRNGRLDTGGDGVLQSVTGPVICLSFAFIVRILYDEECAADRKKPHRFDLVGRRLMEGVEVVAEANPMGFRQLVTRDAERTASEINGAAHVIHRCRGVRVERLRRKDLVSDGVFGSHRRHDLRARLL